MIWWGGKGILGKWTRKRGIIIETHVLKRILIFRRYGKKRSLIKCTGRKVWLRSVAWYIESSHFAGT